MFFNFKQSDFVNDLVNTDYTLSSAKYIDVVSFVKKHPQTNYKLFNKIQRIEI